MTAAPTLAETYIRLAHGIDAHSPGFIDGYGGPDDWADRELRPLAELNGEAQQLAAQVDAEPDDERRTFLQVQLRAMGTMLRRLNGETLAYSEEVLGLYDIDPLREPESTFQAAHTALDGVLPGTGPLAARLDALRAKVALPPGEILRVAGPVIAELRRRTAGLITLPPGEDFSMGLVQDQPWGGYNWPLGNFRSRIDINTDLPVLLPGLPDLLAHEGYPGHHTEHALKELHLSRGLGWQEHSIQLINAPECVVSEGIAVNALQAVMTPGETESWLTGELSAGSGLDPEDVRAYLAASQAMEGLNGVSGNAALLLHEEGRPEAEVLEYFQTYALSTPERARQNLKFISNPNFRAYIFTYTVGGRLVRQAVDAGRVSFADLLTRPYTPGALAGLMAPT